MTSWDDEAWKEAAGEYHAARGVTIPAARATEGANGDDRDEKAKAPLHDWENPDWSMLDDRRGDLPGFPLDCLGGKLRQWVERSANGAGVTPAHVAFRRSASRRA